MTAKPRVLLIADVPNWIFARHCQMLKRFLSDEFIFTIKVRGQAYKESDYDLIYPLEFNQAPAEIGEPSKYVTGIRSYNTWRDQNFITLVKRLTSDFQSVHVVSKKLYDMFENFIPGLTNVAHGVDTAFFRPTSRADMSGKGKLIIGWAGNRNNSVKGFEQFVGPLAHIKGVEVVFCGYDSRNLSMQKTRKFLDSIDVYVCASESEGHNNSLLEAAAMERAIITTNNGTVPEYLQNGVSAIIVERELPSFIQATLSLRDDPEKRVRLGRQARLSVKKCFEWSAKAEDYRLFFRRALKNRSIWHPTPSELLRQISPNLTIKQSENHFRGVRYSPLGEAQALLKQRNQLLEKRLRLANQRFREITQSKRWRYISFVAKAKTIFISPVKNRKKSG